MIKDIPNIGKCKRLEYGDRRKLGDVYTNGKRVPEKFITVVPSQYAFTTWRPVGLL
jgi:hypothetical protein